MIFTLRTKTSITNETFHVVDVEKKSNEDTTKFHLLGLTFIDLCDSFDEDEMFFLSLKTNYLGYDVPLVFFASISQYCVFKPLATLMVAKTSNLFNIVNCFNVMSLTQNAFNKLRTLN